jgi:hypothetical protein
VPNFLAIIFSTPIWFLLMNEFIWEMKEPHGSRLMRGKCVVEMLGVCPLMG